jgi:hypothetical protein
MFDNVHYQFSDLEDILMFVDWLTETFDDPEDFEQWLADRLPMLKDVDDDYSVTLFVNPCEFIDEDIMESVHAEATFWDIIHNEYHHEDDTNGPTIPDTN